MEVLLVIISLKGFEMDKKVESEILKNLIEYYEKEIKRNENSLSRLRGYLTKLQFEKENKDV